MKRLKELRKEKNLTQKEMSVKLNVTQQTYSDYENNKTNPDIETIITLANFFEVSTDYLLGREDDFGNVNIVNDVSTFYTEEEKNLIKEYRTLSEPLKKILLTTIETWKRAGINVQQKKTK